MDELMSQFAVEARELVQLASDDLLALERVPDDRTRLESAFRAVHTLKGSVGLFDFGPMHAVLHRAEDLMSSARANTVTIDASFIDRLLAVIEWVDRCVTQIEKAGELSENLREQSVGILNLLRAEPVPQDVSEVAIEKTPAWAVDLMVAAGLENSFTGDLTAIHYEPHAECFFNGDDPLENIAQLPNIVHLKILPKSAWPSPDVYDPFRCNLVIEAIAKSAIGAIRPAFRLIPDQVQLADLTRFSVKSGEIDSANELAFLADHQGRCFEARRAGGHRRRTGDRQERPPSTCARSASFDGRRAPVANDSCQPSGNRAARFRPL